MDSIELLLAITPLPTASTNTFTAETLHWLFSDLG